MSLNRKKKPAGPHQSIQKQGSKAPLDAKLEILRNTAINSFRSDEKPTKKLIRERMKELKIREQKQRHLAELHNRILQMHQMLPVFSDDGQEGSDEEDGDYTLEEHEEEEEEIEEEVDIYDYDEIDAIDGDEDEDNEENEDGVNQDEAGQDEGEDGNGNVEDLVDLGDDAPFDKATRFKSEAQAIEATEAE